jgi:hypothetical protein
MSASLTDRITEALAPELRANCVSEDPNNGFHSWRCEYPDLYGKCDCFQELLTDLASVLVPIVEAEKAEAWERLCNWLDDHVDSDVRGSVKRAARDSNPYRKDTR